MVSILDSLLCRRKANTIYVEITDPDGLGGKYIFYNFARFNTVQALFLKRTSHYTKLHMHGPT